VASSRSKPQSRRRKEYAAATRAAIIEAARDLFVEQGFVATRVEDIARRARIAVPTVYTSVGGKQAILEILIADLPVWRADTKVNAVKQLETGREILAALARTTRETQENSGDVLRVIKEAAAYDDVARQAHARRMMSFRAVLSEIAARIVELEQLTLTPERVTAVLWFYFGPTAYQPLHDESGWTYPDAEAWLLEQCERAVGLR
jgi:AcrR family transcriptional regulator